MTPTQQKQRQETLKMCRDKMRLKHLALTTERSYLGHIGSYIDWLVLHGSALRDTRARLEAFLTSMAHRVRSPLEVMLPENVIFFPQPKAA